MGPVADLQPKQCGASADGSGRLPPTTLSPKPVNKIGRILRESHVSSLRRLVPPHPCPPELHTTQTAPLMWTMLNKETEKNNLNLSLK